MFFHTFLLDFYQLTTSTTDFKSRSNDVFDRLTNLEKQHDLHTKTHEPIIVPEEETASSVQQNPTIPNHAITFKKRPADDESFARPSDKWKKYDLEDVNDHHTGPMGNQHALHDFLRTRAKPTTSKETTEEEKNELPPAQIFKRPLPKKPVATDEDDDQQFISIRAPISSKPKVDNNDDEDDDDEGSRFKLQSSRPKARGVLSTNEKKVVKPSMEISEENDEQEDEKDDDDDDDDDIDDGLLEP